MKKINKILTNIWPTADHLYIFQSVEYEVPRFWRWFNQHPYSRQLQKKQHLDWTSKARLLMIASQFLIICLTIILTVSLNQNWTWLVLWYLTLSQLSPIFLIISSWLLIPIESRTRKRLISRAIRRRQELKDLKVVAIVGSYAKTSTKDMLYTLLWNKYRVVKTPKSYNTELSLARTINADLKDNTEIFLAEMDAYQIGDIAQLARIAQPTTGVITAIAPQHLERFGSMDNLVKAQFEIVESVQNNHGRMLVNSDDPWMTEQAEKYLTDPIWVGENQMSDLKLSAINQTNSGTSFKIHWKNQSQQINLPLFGGHHAQNFAMAAAIALELGMTLKEIADRARWMLPTPHRLEVNHQGSWTMIDNSYNTNPISAQASFKLLKQLPGKQKILITPGLVELGETADQANISFIEHAATVADYIIIVGHNAKKALIKGLENANYPKEQQIWVETTQQALQLLPKIAVKDAVVLIENDLPDQYF